MIPNSCGILAVVKANAYGHGAVETARALINQGVSRLAVVSVAEGLTLRDSGITGQIVVLGPILEAQIPDLLARELTPVISDLRTCSAIARAAAALGRSVSVHVKVETGMARLGLTSDELPRLFEALADVKSIRIEGLMTHLADADGDSSDLTDAQLQTFRATLGTFARRGIHLPLVHVANSAAILRFPESHFSLVRPGIMLYGYHTLPKTVPSPNLKPVLQFHSTIVHLRTIEAGTTVSYNRTFAARRKSTIAVLPIGYADGYNRLLSNRGKVLVRGKRVPVAGLVCMDMTMIDVTEVPDVQVGDRVTLIGRDGQETVFADEVADWIGTIPYEVLCGIGSRVPRLYDSPAGTVPV